MSRKKFDIVPVYEELTGGRALTRHFWAPCKCPVHEDRNASASLNEDYGVIVCHACGWKGDAIALVMELEHIEFREAVARCREITGQEGGSFGKGGNATPSKPPTLGGASTKPPSVRRRRKKG